MVFGTEYGKFVVYAVVVRREAGVDDDFFAAYFEEDGGGVAAVFVADFIDEEVGDVAGVEGGGVANGVVYVDDGVTCKRRCNDGDAD